MSKKDKNKVVPKLRFKEFTKEDGWKTMAVADLIMQHNEKADSNKQYPVLTSSRNGIFFQKDYYNNRDVASDDTTGYNVAPRGFFTYRHMSDDLIFKFNINNICDKGIVSTLYPVFSAKENVVVPYFLQLVLNEGKEFKDFAISQKQGGSRTYMYLSKLRELIVQLPSYIEQQKIADCLSSLDELINAESQQLEALEAHKKGLMQQLFPAQGEMIPKLRFKEFRDSGEWEENVLTGEDIAVFANKKLSVSELSLETYVSTENLLPNYAGKTMASKLPASGSFTRYKAGDVLVSNIRPYLKKVWTATTDGAASNDVIVIRAASKINSSFLSCYLKDDHFITYVMKGAEGVKMPRGDKDLIKEYPLMFPTKVEQQKIASCLSSLDELISAQTEKIEGLKVHKKGLMQGLFPEKVY